MSGAYLSVAGVVIIHWSSPYVWALVGAVSGATVGATSRGTLRGLVVGGVAGSTIMGIYVVALFGLNLEFFYEVICAALGGSLMGGLVEGVHRAEKRAAIPRTVMAAVLVLAVIIGNLVARWIVPGW